MSTLSEKAHNLPPTPGVYLFKDAAGGVLYVGKARSLAQRVRSYLGSDLEEPRLRELMSKAADLDAILTDTEVEALLLESTMVRQHRPHYNILLKDDKSFPYVRVSVQEEYPRLSVTRHVRGVGARYLGPFTDVKLLRRTLRRQAQEFLERPFVKRYCQRLDYGMSPAEKALYDDVTAWLLEPDLVAFSGRHRRLLLIGFHRRMASSLRALADSLERVAARLRGSALICSALPMCSSILANWASTSSSSPRRYALPAINTPSVTLILIRL